MSDYEIVPVEKAEIMVVPEAQSILAQIRPQWQAKDLITRVRRLINVDPSSACQRLLNASIHDLREKVIIAGIDIAKEMAKQNKLPPIESNNDIEEYPTSKLIDLSYRIGLISHSEWRRISRAYEIRRDLEHEDNNYVADIADIIYIFKACVEIVLAKDPIQLLRVADIKEVIEHEGPAVPNEPILEDYKSMPPTRQKEIMLFLISYALDDTKPDIVRQNAFNTITLLKPITQNPVILDIAQNLQDKLGRGKIGKFFARVAYASGTLAYLRQAQLTDYYHEILNKLTSAGHRWTENAKHGIILRLLVEVGGLSYCPPNVRKEIIEWMVLAYIGEPGGYGLGTSRKVFFSDTAAPYIKMMIKEVSNVIGDDLRQCEKNDHVKAALGNEHVARRYQSLLDLIETT